MISNQVACEDLLCNFIMHMSKWYGNSVTDCVVCFADGVELHYHHDGGNDNYEKEKINS